jgi:hypothetical protein
LEPDEEEQLIIDATGLVPLSIRALERMISVGPGDSTYSSVPSAVEAFSRSEANHIFMHLHSSTEKILREHPSLSKVFASMMAAALGGYGSSNIFEPLYDHRYFYKKITI